jgi:16S rRNA A1518/A1519 N6-dimethyltransferase RsmA/KsgA/DIM1 with predicted DNA glycosylase/AP lyase activity
MTVQKEVAQRVTAAPGHLSLLAVSVQFYGEPTYVGKSRPALSGPARGGFGDFAH